MGGIINTLDLTWFWILLLINYFVTLSTDDLALPSLGYHILNKDNNNVYLTAL